MNKLRFIALIIATFSIISCSTMDKEYEIYIFPDPETSFYETSFNKKFNHIIKPICKYVKNKSVFVADIVNYKTLKSDEKGLFLTEYLKSSISNQCKTEIIQIEFTKNIILRKSGNIVLSRNIEKIKNKSIKTNYIVVATYKDTGSYIILFLRLLDVKTGNVEKFITKKIRYYSPLWIRL